MAEPQDVLAGAVADLRGREIERRRGARDLWISRSHVLAAATAAGAFAFLAFGLGWMLGSSATPPPARATLTSELPREELLELLARIDGNSAGVGAAQAITFPDALMGQAVSPEAAATEAPGEEPVVHVEGDASAELGDAVVVPTSGFTVVVGRFDALPDARQLRDRLEAAGIEAWVGTEAVDGVVRHRVAVGQHATQEAANEALPLLQGLGPVTVEAVAP